MFATTHSLISHYYCRLFVLIQYASMMTKYPPPSNYVINSLRALTVVFGRLYHLLRAQLGPGIPASTHWSSWYLRLVRRCKNHLYEGLLVVPGLRLDRSTRRRRMKGRRSDPRPLGRSERRVISCLRAWKRKKVRSSQRVWSLGMIVLKKM